MLVLLLVAVVVLGDVDVVGDVVGDDSVAVVDFAAAAVAVITDKLLMWLLFLLLVLLLLLPLPILPPHPSDDKQKCPGWVTVRYFASLFHPEKNKTMKENVSIG